jgi:hypothetical protein
MSNQGVPTEAPKPGHLLGLEPCGWWPHGCTGPQCPREPGPRMETIVEGFGAHSCGWSLSRRTWRGGHQTWPFAQLGLEMVPEDWPDFHPKTWLGTEGTLITWYWQTGKTDLFWQPQGLVFRNSIKVSPPLPRLLLVPGYVYCIPIAIWALPNLSLWYISLWC